jgi:hypothetical protein
VQPAVRELKAIPKAKKPLSKITWFSKGLSPGMKYQFLNLTLGKEIEASRNLLRIAAECLGQRRTSPPAVKASQDLQALSKRVLVGIAHRMQFHAK